MIFELEREHFYRCKDLVNRTFNIECKAIVEGINPGRIFVDNIEDPKSALIWQGNLDGYNFVGNANNPTFNREIRQFIDQEIIPQAKALGLNWFECIGDHSSWYSVIKNDLFPDKELVSWNQFVYTLLPHEHECSSLSTDLQEYSVVQITNELLANESIQNLVFLESEILEFWENTSDFFKKGFGFCALHNNQVVSVCLTGFRYKNFHGIDIVTIESYRGKKLAQWVACTYLDYCFDNGYIPYWDCSESNVSSNAVAQKLGFKKEFSYKGYYFAI